MIRITGVDALRGIAILMMVIYHIIFDINYFGIAPIDIYSLPLVLFQRVTGSSFLLLVGVSLSLSESRNKEGYMRHARRGAWLACVALAITVGTWVFPHDGFITFGIIHLIALSTFIAPFFFRFGKLNVLFGLFAIAAGLMMVGLQTDSHYLFWLGLTYPGYTALDYYPLLPWFGLILIGMYAGSLVVRRGGLDLPAGKRLSERLALLGRNSLAIYLVHQPIVVGVILALKYAGLI